MPTLLEAAGLTASEETDGISFLPSLINSDAQEKHDFMYWEFPSYGGQQAVRMGNWKGIRKDILKGNMQIELYDLKNDPRETMDVSTDFPEIADQIKEIMKNEHKEAAIPRFRMEALGDTTEENE